MSLMLISGVFAQEFDLQGHRGCRGIMPENSLEGFRKAIDLGVTTIEMDVVISADEQVVVSHDPFISPTFCVSEIGTPLRKKDKDKLNIYTMDYDNVRMFDCGSIGNPSFPDQEKINTFKPLLSEVIEQSEAQSSNSIRYNIQLKSRKSWDDVYQPSPDRFCDLVYDVIQDQIDPERITIQSFDVRILRYMKRRYPDFRVALLEGMSKSADKSIEALGFEPEIYSPNYRFVKEKMIADLHARDIKVIPWPVNELKDMQRMSELGVDGLITDYPSLFIENFQAKK